MRFQVAFQAYNLFRTKLAMPSEFNPLFLHARPVALSVVPHRNWARESDKPGMV